MMELQSLFGDGVFVVIVVLRAVDMDHLPAADVLIDLVFDFLRHFEEKRLSVVADVSSISNFPKAI